MDAKSTSINQWKCFGISLREPISGISHLIMGLLYIAGTIFLLRSSLEEYIPAFAIYGTSIVTMFLASAAYHLCSSHTVLIQHLRAIDHASIYLFIAGTYTPICLRFFEGFWREGLLYIVWIIAVIGITLKIFFLGAPRWLTAFVYVAMGWLSFFAIGQMLTNMPRPAFYLLLSGGIIYTLGAFIYVIKQPNPIPGTLGFHEIWHLFVIAGSICHFFVVACYIA